MIDMYLDSIVSAVLGGALTTALAKAFIARSLDELDEVVTKIGEINTQLAAIAVKIELVDRDREIILKHDRKIAALENQVYRRKESEPCKS